MVKAEAAWKREKQRRGGEEEKSKRHRREGKKIRNLLTILPFRKNILFNLTL